MSTVFGSCSHQEDWLGAMRCHSFTVIALWWLCLLVTHARKLNVALHAQLFPSADKVVGSVITTDGLKAAFLLSHQVKHADVFYPSRYAHYLNHTWDLVLIEGWFPSIDVFILLTRNNFPQATIVFICLDPAYPGKRQVANFDVDGILTNSVPLLEYFKGRFPADHMLLAADPTIMRPYPNVTRDWGAIYVGAGGHMLQVKPELHSLLTQALPYGLRLHGSSWESVPEFRAVAMGTLPQGQLAQAYASAHVVLASTIQSQSQHGMVNNRIFEALSCGALVVTKWAPELAALQCPALLLIEDNQSLSDYMDAVLYGDQSVVAGLREAGREWVLQQHTWANRAVQILDFYHHIHSKHDVHINTNSPTRASTVEVCGTARCTRPNCPKLLWVVSAPLQHHSDTVFVARSIGQLHLCTLFHVHAYVHTHMLFDALATELSSYEVLLAYVTPFDALDLAVRALPSVHLPAADVDLGGPRVQKRACYIIGYDPSLVLTFLYSNVLDNVGADVLNMHHYDAVLYRSAYEMEQLASVGVVVSEPERMQLMFGVGSPVDRTVGEGSVDALKADQARVVMVCFYTHAHLCHRATRELYVRKVRTDYLRYAPSLRDTMLPAYTLLCLGGQWRDWLRLTDASDGLPLLHHADLPYTVHVRDGWTGDAVRMVQGAEVVVIMNPAGPAAHSKCTAGLHTHSTSHTVEALRCQVREGHSGATTEEVLWPLVAAAVSSTRVHLLHRSAQLMDLVAVGDCSSWDAAFLRTAMVKVGVNRLLGLGSRLSAVTPRLLQTQLVLTGAVDGLGVQCNVQAGGTALCPEEDVALLQAFGASHEAPAGSDDAGTRFALIELHFDEFVTGRDGEACIVQPDVLLNEYEEGVEGADGSVWKAADGNRPGDKVCLMRPYKYVAVVLHPEGASATDPSGAHSCSPTVDLSFQLRGNFFGDAFYFANLSVNVEDSPHLPRVPSKWSSAWLDKFSVFVHNAHYC